jgi:peptide/nickel transport system substrate-binding protein
MYQRRSQRSLRRLASVLLLAAVIGATATSAEAHRTAGTTAIVRFPADYLVLDFMQRATQGVTPYSYPTYDRLLAFDQTGTKVVPDIVTSYTATPADRPKVWVFHLKHGVMCADGHQLTPIDVLNSYRRFFAVPKISNQLPAFFGPGPFQLHASMKAWTFRFTTLTPFANAVFGFAQTGIICPAGLAALQSDPNALNTQTYGTGPYTLVSAAHNDQVVYQKNPKWNWGPTGTNIKTMPDTLIYKIIPDQTTAANVLLTGGVDIAPITGPDVQRLAANGSLVHKVARNYYPMMVNFSQTPGRVTADDKVRQAIMSAISPRDFMTASGWSATIINPSYYATGEKCHLPASKLAQYIPTGGVSKAQQIMQQDGWTLSNGILTKGGQTAKLTLVTANDLMGGVGQYLASQLKQVGFDVNLQDTAAGQYGVNYISGAWDVGVSLSFQYYPGPLYNLPLYYGAESPKGGNHGMVGDGDQDYIRAAQFAQQRTDCYWGYQLQQVMLQHHISYPMGEQATDVFGDQHWNFPPGIPSLEPEWLTATGK